MIELGIKAIIKFFLNPLFSLSNKYLNCLIFSDFKFLTPTLFRTQPRGLFRALFITGNTPTMMIPCAKWPEIPDYKMSTVNLLPKILGITLSI